MKILHTVEFYHPSTGGMQTVVRELSERLARLGHQVTVATKKLPERNFTELNGVTIASFGISGRAASGYQAEPGEIERYQKLLTGGDFDVITNFAAQQWATDIALPLLPQIRAKKVFVPTGFSGLYLPQFRNYFQDLKTWIKNYDWQIFLSDDYRDINFARALGLHNFEVIPNGAGADEFLEPSTIDIRARLGIPKDNFLIVHIGSHTGLKGHKAARKIFAKADLPHSTLLIIGNRFANHPGCAPACQQAAKDWNRKSRHQERGQQLLNLDLDREQAVAALKDAQLFLFPSNIECSPIVLFEAMAARLPFLSTAVGNAAEIIRWSGGGELLPTRLSRYANDNPLKRLIKSLLFALENLSGQEKIPATYSSARIKASARLLCDLYGDQKRRQRLADQGFRAWQEKFTWEKISERYEQTYKRLLNL